MVKKKKNVCEECEVIKLRPKYLSFEHYLSQKIVKECNINIKGVLCGINH